MKNWGRHLSSGRGGDWTGTFNAVCCLHYNTIALLKHDSNHGFFSSFSLSSQSEKVLLRTHLYLNLFATVLKKYYLKKDVFLVAAAKISFDNTFVLNPLPFNSSLVVNCVDFSLNKYIVEFGLFCKCRKINEQLIISVFL